MKNKKISIIIPVYNSEKDLYRCIDSAINQTYLQKEIILVNDGSTDSSGKICDSFSEKYSFVNTIYQKNSGAAAARQKGISLATGDYITFLDADDFFENDYIEKMMLNIDYNEADVVIGSMKNYNGTNYSEYNLYFESGFYNKIRLQKEVFPQMLSAHPFFTFGVLPAMWGKIWKKSIAEKNLDALGAGVTFGEDGCFTFSALLDCNLVCFTNVSGYVYCLNEESVTHNFKKCLIEETPRLVNFYEELSKKKNWAIGTQLEEYTAYVCNYVIQLAMCAKNFDYKNSKDLLEKYIKNNFPNMLQKNKKIKTSSKTTKLKYFLVKNSKFLLLKWLLKWRRII